jgi:hypothetical protein
MTWRRRAIDSYADMPPERLGIPFLDGEESAITVQSCIDAGHGKLDTTLSMNRTCN